MSDGLDGLTLRTGGKMIVRELGFDMWADSGDPGLACCFTGHRPRKMPFPWGHGERYEAFRGNLCRLLCDIAGLGYRRFITGMAQGTDLLCAHIILTMRGIPDMSGLRLECAVPNNFFTARWGRDDLAEFEYTKSAADKVTLINDGAYNVADYEARNRYMVDRSDLVLAVFGGGTGGTKNTLEYARSINRRILILNPADNTLTKI